MTLRAQLEAIRTGGLAQAAMASAILAALPPDVSPEPVRVSPSAVERSSGTCPHVLDHRLDAARMGAPTAWVCGDCGYKSEEPEEGGSA